MSGIDFSKFVYKQSASGDHHTSENRPVPPLNESFTHYLSNRGKPIKQNKKTGKARLAKEADSSLSPPDDVQTAGLFELYKSSSQTKEDRLRLLIVGHNPSHVSWERGHYYANPSNRMWPLLAKAGITPTHFRCNDDQECPIQLGIGFTDVLSGHCETQSSKISDEKVASAKDGFYNRLLAHVERVHQSTSLPLLECYPRVIAFAGVRQYRALFDDDNKANSNKSPSKKRKAATIISSSIKQIKLDSYFTSHAENNRPAGEDDTIDLSLTTIEEKEQEQEANKNTSINSSTKYGIQTDRPSDWPELLSQSVIFLLPSSSGAAAMTNEAREGPYIELGQLLGSTFPLPGGESGVSATDD